MDRTERTDGTDTTRGTVVMEGAQGSSLRAAMDPVARRLRRGDAEAASRGSAARWDFSSGGATVVRREGGEAESVCEGYDVRSPRGSTKIAGPILVARQGVISVPPAWCTTVTGSSAGSSPAALHANRIIGHRTQIHSPKLNAYAERMQQTLQVECLDKFLVLGSTHLDYLVAEYIDHYNTERPHSGIGFQVPENVDAPPKLRPVGDTPNSVGRVPRKERLGGVIKHYTSMAA